MATNEECKDLVKNIKNGIYKIGVNQINFLNGFVSSKNETYTEEEITKEANSLVRKLQRVLSCECTDKTLGKLREIYNFLLSEDEYKKITIYKPLEDDGFEREVLGDDLYEKIKESSENIEN